MGILTAWELHTWSVLLSRHSSAIGNLKAGLTGDPSSSLILSAEVWMVDLPALGALLPSPSLEHFRSMSTHFTSKPKRPTEFPTKHSEEIQLGYQEAPGFATSTEAAVAKATGESCVSGPISAQLRGWAGSEVPAVEETILAWSAFARHCPPEVSHKAFPE